MQGTSKCWEGDKFVFVKVTRRNPVGTWSGAYISLHIQHIYVILYKYIERSIYLYIYIHIPKLYIGSDQA